MVSSSYPLWGAAYAIEAGDAQAFQDLSTAIDSL